MASIYDTPDVDLADAYKYAQLQPHEQIALRRRIAEQGVERGVENAARGALGLPQSQRQNRESAGQELMALGQKVAPGTPEFYTQAAAIFRKYNMLAEAEKMEQSRQALEMGKAELSPIMKLQRAKQELLKQKATGANVDAALAAVDREIAQLGTRAEGSKAAEPEFIRLLNAYEKATAAGQGDRAELIKKAMDVWIKNKEGTGEATALYRKLRLELDRQKEKRAQDKEDRKVEAADAAIVSALQGTVRLLDNDIQSAERLLAHSGLSWITGARAGLAGRAAAALSSDAAGAHALLLNVQAQTFIKALQDLKATSRTGASGLGQLTEREGDKIQNAKTALDPQQPTDQFKRTLASYIDQLKAARAAGASELTGVAAEVPAPPKPITDKSDKPTIPPIPGVEAPKAKRKLTATRVN